MIKERIKEMIRQAGTTADTLKACRPMLKAKRITEILNNRPAKEV